MLIMWETVCVGQGIYGKSLYFPLNFIVNLNFLLKINSSEKKNITLEHLHALLY